MAHKFDKNDFFKKLVGNWKGTAKTYFKPNELADTSPIKGKIIEILNGSFLLHEYEGTLMNEKMLGLAIYGYNENKNQFEIAWVDNQHMDSEIMFSTGENSDDIFSVLGKYAVGDQLWGWRTTIELKNAEDMSIRHYNITPDGQEGLGVDIKYKKVK